MTCSRAEWLVWLSLGGCAAEKDPCAEGPIVAWEGAKEWEESPFARTVHVDLDEGDTLTFCPGEWVASFFVEATAGAVIRGAGASLSPNGTRVLGVTGGAEILDLAATDAEFAYTQGAIALFQGDYLVQGVEIRGNATSETGGGILVGSDTDVTVRDSRIIGNTSSLSGGGALLSAAGAVLRSEHTDWGEGEDDNSPDDVAIINDDGDVLASYTFGDDATFTCDWDARTCE